MKMTEASGKTAAPGTALIAIVLIAAVLRLLHLATSLENPFLYALSPDEIYHLKFARDVAGGGLGLSQGLNFMDPLYGYILGAMAWMTGEDLFLMRLAQAGVDTLNVYLIYRIGKELATPRAGLFAAAVYAVFGAAIFYSPLFLKTTWVASFCLLWVLLLLHSERRGLWFWLGTGAFVSMCVMLRSNLLLLAPATLAWILWRDWNHKGRMATGLVAFGAGLVLAMSLSAWRQQAITGEWQWLPSNGGIVLYQVYNPQYVETGRVMPDFVVFLNPGEMQYDFVKEAEHRTGRAMSLAQTNAYFSGEALRYIHENPVAVFRHLAGNLLSFVSGHEVPNNRSYYVDRQYSSILQLPMGGFSLLLALGSFGLAIAVRRDVRSIVLWAPIGVGLVTCMVFFDFSRFRYPAAPMLAIAAGISLEWLWLRVAEKRWAPASLAAGLALAIGLSSAVLGWRSGSANIDEQQLANAQIEAGQLDSAEATINSALQRSPDSSALYEMLGIVAARRSDNAAAIRFNQRALKLDAQRHVAWHNLSLAYIEPEQRPEALAAIRKAIALRPLPDYRYRLARLLEKDQPEAARGMYEVLQDELVLDSPLRRRVSTRLERLPGS